MYSFSILAMLCYALIILLSDVCLLLQPMLSISMPLLPANFYASIQAAVWPFWVHFRFNISHSSFTHADGSLLLFMLSVRLNLLSLVNLAGYNINALPPSIQFYAVWAANWQTCDIFFLPVTAFHFNARQCLSAASMSHGCSMLPILNAILSSACIDVVQLLKWWKVGLQSQATTWYFTSNSTLWLRSWATTSICFKPYAMTICSFERTLA